MFGVSEKVLKMLREEYPQGTRIVLTSDLEDKFAPLPAGSKGTVDMVDDAGQVHVNFDSGNRLGLIYGVDGYRKE